MDYKLLQFDTATKELQVQFPLESENVHKMTLPDGPEDKLPFFHAFQLDLFIRDHLPHTVVNGVKIQEMSETDIKELESQLNLLNIKFDEDNLWDLV